MVSAIQCPLYLKYEYICFSINMTMLFMAVAFSAFNNLFNHYSNYDLKQHCCTSFRKGIGF